MKLILKVLLISFLILTNINAKSLQECKWSKRKNAPCITIYKTPNTSNYNEQVVNKKIITKQNILSTGATDINDVLKLISGLDVFQSGQKGQQTSIFTRGSESNHTLVLLNGIAINDQSVTDGLHDFGQDFVQLYNKLKFTKAPMVHILDQVQ